MRHARNSLQYRPPAAALIVSARVTATSMDPSRGLTSHGALAASMDRPRHMVPWLRPWIAHVTWLVGRSSRRVMRGVAVTSGVTQSHVRRAGPELRRCVAVFASSCVGSGGAAGDTRSQKRTVAIVAN